IDRDLAQLVADRDARADEAERLRVQLGEIDAVAPEPGEDTAVAERAERLQNAESLREAALISREALSSEDGTHDVSTLLGEARHALDRAEDPALDAVRDLVADLAIRAGDAAGELSSYLADLDEHGPHELQAVEERRAALADLVRAHGSLDAA